MRRRSSPEPDQESDAFRYLERVERERADTDEQQEDIWTIRGTDQIESRVHGLASDANTDLLYACGTDELTPETIAVLNDRARSGVDVTFVSTDADFDAFHAGVRTVRFPDHLQPARKQSGRAITVDDRSLLLSVRENRRVRGGPVETAIWSDKTAFAAVLYELLKGWVTTHLDVDLSRDARI